MPEAEESRSDAQLTARFDEALVWSSQLHRGQQRKQSRVPYVSHLLRVCAIVLEHGGSEDEAIAALLHDAVEDQGGLPVLDEIRTRFGERVAEIVWGCTESEYEVPKPPWRLRKNEFLARLRTADSGTRRVVAADKLANCHSYLLDFEIHGQAIWRRFSRSGTVWYLREVTRILRSAEHTVLVRELERAVEEVAEIAQAKGAAAAD